MSGKAVYSTRKCATCGTLLLLEKGDPGDWDNPGTPPAAYCEECGVDTDLTDEEWHQLFGEGE